jgi:hypothetical protein
MPYRDDLEALEHRCKDLESQSTALTSELAAARALLAEAQARRKLPVLDNIRVAAPCSADWNKMVGNDRVRACASCQQNVYDLSGMTRTEAQELLAERGENVCVRFYRRKNGTILTADCAVGVRERKQRYRWIGALAAVCSVLTYGAAWFSSGLEQKSRDEFEVWLERVVVDQHMGKYSSDPR